MKLISLNIWGGRAGKEKLLSFFKDHSDIDIFCLQEVWSAPYGHLEGATIGGTITFNDDVMTEGKQEIAAALPEHEVFFHPHHLENYGLMMLVKKSFSVTDSGDVFVHKHRGYIPEGDVGNHARNIQYVTVNTSAGKRTIINFHGLWTNGTWKEDTYDRLVQSENIAAFLKDVGNPFILCGDFNLLPETESLKRLEDLGLRNLIKEYGITSTRTSYYTKEGKFADYALVSNGIDVKDFKILPDEVSDHSPMHLEFE